MMERGPRSYGSAVRRLVGLVSLLPASSLGGNEKKRLVVYPRTLVSMGRKSDQSPALRSSSPRRLRSQCDAECRCMCLSYLSVSRAQGSCDVRDRRTISQ